MALPDGGKKEEVTLKAPITEAVELGKTVGEQLLSKDGAKILKVMEDSKPIFVRPHPGAD